MSEKIIRSYVQEAIESFVKDPPDSAFQRGYLEALIVIWREALTNGDTTYDELNKLTVRPTSELN